MAPKAKKGRGKTMKITEFTEDHIPADTLDWADEDWIIENQNQETKSEKFGKRQAYSRTANNALGQEESFRTADMRQPEMRQSDCELHPPYVAHFGNLRNGTTEEEFLNMFNKDVVVTHRLISQEGRTFAFVEFSSEQALRVALSFDGTIQRARRMYVDLATARQVERLLDCTSSGAKSGPSREGPGQAGGLATMELSRNVFGGQQQPDSPLFATDRSGFGSRQDLTLLGDLSRDMLGSAQPAPLPQSNFHFSENTGSLLDLENWRSEGPTTQPEFRDMPERKPSSPKFEQFRSGNNAQAEKGGKRNISTASVPSGNWRDEEPVEVPPLQEDGNAWMRKKGDAPVEMGGGRGRGRGRGRGGGHERIFTKESSSTEKDWASFRK